MREDISVEAYYRFLEAKMDVAPLGGWHIAPAETHESLFPHQRDITVWAVRHGRGLIAASFGLGKTRIECDLVRLVHERTGKQTLIVCPLGVKHQFQEEDGPAMGMRIQYVRTDAEALEATTPYLITNYERVRDGDISAEYIARHIGGVTLDEGNVLRSLGSLTQQTFNQVLKPVPYRWVATATPSPNRYKELIYYAEFLGVMDAGQALTRWFKRDSSQAGNLKVHPHHEREFWLWVASWALFITRPSDLGYSDEGYEMPALNVHWHRISSDHKKAWETTDNFGQRYLFNWSANSLTAAAREKRETISERVQAAAEIVEGHPPDTHWIIWHHLEAERHEIKRHIDEALDVYGSQDIEVRERRILDFTHGRYRILATKPEIAGSGCNFQYHCHHAIYVGVRYQFDEFIQSIHRLQRFQQRHPVHVHIIYTDAEDDIVQVLKRKWQRHDELVARMTRIIQEHGMTNEAIHSDLKRSLGALRQEQSGHFYTCVNNDSVEELQRLGDESVDLIHTSIPFGNHYEYSASYNDFGHNTADDAFWEQMEFMTPHLLRVLKPGRIAAIHVKDRLLYGHQTGHGTMEISPFSDDCVAHFRAHGFIYFGRITVVTDVVRENSSTYRLGWTENGKDGTKMGVGMPEYILLFRKLQTDRTRSYADEPVVKSKETYTRARWQLDAHSFWRSNGNRLLRPEEIAEIEPERLVGMETGQIYRWWQAMNREEVYDFDRHVELSEAIEEAGRLPSSFMLFPPQAPPHADAAVWTDVVYMRTLNSDQSRGRMENHVCPLPFDIVDRIIQRYSNEGELVLDPFGGLMTVPYRAIQLGRRAYGIELSEDYWRWGSKYCFEAEQQRLAPTLFDLDALEAPTNGNGAAPQTAREALA